MFKKCFLFFLCFMLIASSCAVAFSSFAVVETVSLPFPSPEKFGDLPVLVFERSDGLYVMIVLYLPEREYMFYEGDYDLADYKLFGQSTQWLYVDKKIKVNTGLGYVNELTTSSWCVPIVYNYKPSNGYYNVQVKGGFDPNDGIEQVFAFSSSYTGSNFIAYNGSYFEPNSNSTVQYTKSFIFEGELNPADIHSYLVSIDNSLSIALQSITNWQASQTSKFTRFIAEYTEMNRTLSTIGRDVHILVDSMTESHSAPDTTVNSAFSDYNSAENEVGQQHFNALDNFNVPDFSSGLADGLSAALSFLSLQIEDFTGNGSGITDGGARKIASVIFVVLMLGLVTLILAMNRRTD